MRDKYTISFKLKEPDFNFLYVLAMPNVVPVAREVIEAYGDDTMGHPVGTGPFVLKEWVRRSKIVLERNPNHRGYELETRYANPDDEWDRRAIEALRGKRLPLLDRVEIYPIEDEQPRYLAFVNKEHDILDELPFAFVHQVLPNGKLAPRSRSWACASSASSSPRSPTTSSTWSDAGGRRLHARDAWRCAARWCSPTTATQEINIVRKGQALPGADAGAAGRRRLRRRVSAPRSRTTTRRAPRRCSTCSATSTATATAGASSPTASRFTISYKYDAGSQEKRQLAELWSKSMADIGIRIEATAVQFADLLNDKRVGKFQMAGSAWIADYPDAQNFLQLLYGPNTGQSNEARFKLPEYDRTVRAVAGASRRPGAQRALPRDEPADPRLRAVAPGRAPHLQPPAVPLGEGVQEAPDPLYQLQVPGHRHGDPAGRARK